MLRNKQPQYAVAYNDPHLFCRSKLQVDCSTMDLTGQLCSIWGSAGLGSGVLAGFSSAPLCVYSRAKDKTHSWPTVLSHGRSTKLSQKTQAHLSPLLASHLLTFHWSKQVTQHQQHRLDVTHSRKGKDVNIG